MIPPLNPCSCEGVTWATVDGARWFVHCENCGNSVSAWSGRAVVWPEKGHFLYGVRKFRMRRKRWIPGLTFIPRWSGILCRIAP